MGFSVKMIVILFVIVPVLIVGLIAYVYSEKYGKETVSVKEPASASESAPSSNSTKDKESSNPRPSNDGGSAQGSEEKGILNSGERIYIDEFRQAMHNRRQSVMYIEPSNTTGHINSNTWTQQDEQPNAQEEIVKIDCSRIDMFHRILNPVMQKIQYEQITEAQWEILFLISRMHIIHALLNRYMRALQCGRLTIKQWSETLDNTKEYLSIWEFILLLPLLIQQSTLLALENTGAPNNDEKNLADERFDERILALWESENQSMRAFEDDNMRTLIASNAPNQGDKDLSQGTTHIIQGISNADIERLIKQGTEDKQGYAVSATAHQPRRGGKIKIVSRDATWHIDEENDIKELCSICLECLLSNKKKVNGASYLVACSKSKDANIFHAECFANLSVTMHGFKIVCPFCRRDCEDTVYDAMTEKPINVLNMPLRIEIVERLKGKREDIPDDPLYDPLDERLFFYDCMRIREFYTGIFERNQNE